MRLEEFNLNLSAVVMAPLICDRAQPDWQDAKDTGILPPSVFALYERSNYLSFGAWPQFLSDDRHFLFGYFGLVLRSMKDCLVDADFELKLLEGAHGRGYDPDKQSAGVTWDPEADSIVRRSFQSLLASLLSTLDCSADLVALFLTNSIPRLQVGKASFSAIETWLSRPSPNLGLIATPQQQRAYDLHQRLRPLLDVQGEARDWLTFARILRNKSAHIRNSLRNSVFKHSNGELYTFLPKQWPYLWEQYLSRGDEEPPAGAKPMPQLLMENLIHEDLLTFARNLRERVTTLAGETLAVVNEMYAQFENFQPNLPALVQLINNFEMTDFVAFKS
jgi:hypothetical protein